MAYLSEECIRQQVQPKDNYESRLKLIQNGNFVSPRQPQLVLTSFDAERLKELAGDKLLDGYNTLILAPTAGGKTEACMFPLLAQMVEREPLSITHRSCNICGANITRSDPNNR